MILIYIYRYTPVFTDHLPTTMFVVHIYDDDIIYMRCALRGLSPGTECGASADVARFSIKRSHIPIPCAYPYSTPTTPTIVVPYSVLAGELVPDRG